MKANIIYLLSPAGQKESILSGGDGLKRQTVSVTRDDPEFRAAVVAGQVQQDGSVLLDLQSLIKLSPSDYSVSDNAPEFDGPQTAASLLAWHNAALIRLAARKDENQEAERKRREEGENHDAAAIAAYRALPVAQRIRKPYGVWEPIQIAMKARWSDQPSDLYAEAIAEAKRLNELEAEADRLKREEAAQAERDRRAVLGLEDGDLDLRIENGALMEAPVWENNKRGKNWFACVTPDPSSPGGLNRTFAPKAKGDALYLVQELAVGNAVEFGADYYSGSNRKSASRWYGFVVRITAEMLVVRKCATGKAAHKAGQQYAAEHLTESSPSN